MGGLVSAFTGDFIASPKVAEVLIAPLDEEGALVTDDSFGPTKRVLQYWPESLSDSKSANWQSRDIPGAPLPLYQWVNGSERPLSFTANFSRDMDGEIGVDLDEDKHNVDIDAAIAWLRMLSANDYRAVGDMQAAIAPPTLWLMFMGTKLGYNDKAIPAESYTYDSGIYCILNSVEVERVDWFPSGRPRFANVSLSFFETMQIGRGVYPYGRSGMKALADKYRRTLSE